MKVLMFGWEYPPYITGGLGTACYGIVKGLTSYPEIELTFVLPKAQDIHNTDRVRIVSASDVELSSSDIELQKMLEEDYIKGRLAHISAYITPEQYEELIRARYREEINNYTKNGGKLTVSGQYEGNLFNEISRYARIASEIARKQQHDVIHAHDWLTFQAGMEAKKISNKPLVLHVHATEFDRSGENYNPGVYKIEKEGMEMADRIITVSEFTRNIVINKYGINPAKVVTVHNAVDQVENVKNIKFQPYINEKVVTYLGRITYQKGPEYFILAAQKVLERMNNVRFVMAGSGDLSEKMIRYVASLGISDKFHFTGFLRGNDVFKMYSMSNLYVMPSVSEPFGISPLEALQSGVPVIISKQSGVAEVINHAIKVDFWDVHAMADAIYAIVNYGAIGNHMKNMGQKEVQNMRWSDTAGKIRNVYYDLFHRHAS